MFNFNPIFKASNNLQSSILSLSVRLPKLANCTLIFAIVQGFLANKLQKLFGQLTSHWVITILWVFTAEQCCSLIITKGIAIIVQCHSNMLLMYTLQTQSHYIERLVISYQTTTSGPASFTHNPCIPPYTHKHTHTVFLFMSKPQLLLLPAGREIAGKSFCS